jgi:hypothetical protein
VHLFQVGRLRQSAGVGSQDPLGTKLHMSSLNRLNGLNRIEQLARTGPFKPFNRCASVQIVQD